MKLCLFDTTSIASLTTRINATFLAVIPVNITGKRNGVSMVKYEDRYFGDLCNITKEVCLDDATMKMHQ
jgi:hypothetical protein